MTSKLAYRVGLHCTMMLISSRSMARAYGTRSKVHCPNGLLKKGTVFQQSLRPPLIIVRRFPVIAGLAVEWDHSKPSGNRVNSIRVVVPRVHDDSDDDDPKDMVNFVEQEDGTRVEVKQREIELGEEIKNESGGKIYRVVSEWSQLWECANVLQRLQESTWQMGQLGFMSGRRTDGRSAMMVSKRSRIENSSLMTRADRS